MNTNRILACLAVGFIAGVILYEVATSQNIPQTDPRLLVPALIVVFVLGAVALGKEKS